MRRPVIYGDVVTYAGKIAEKDDANGRVKLEITGANQEGEIATTGHAEVELPRKREV